jgi:hypothetical protein
LAARKTIRNVVISTVALLVLIVGAGLAYTFYLGPTATQNIPATKTNTTPAVIKPSVPSSDAKEFAAIEFLTSPMQAGTNAQISVKTLPASSCKITVTYNKVPSTDSGLKTKTANEYGVVDWTWTVGKTTPVGKWPVEVTCAYHGRTAYVRGDLEITK